MQNRSTTGKSLCSGSFLREESLELGGGRGNAGGGRGSGRTHAEECGVISIDVVVYLKTLDLHCEQIQVETGHSVSVHACHDGVLLSWDVVRLDY